MGAKTLDLMTCSVVDLDEFLAGKSDSDVKTILTNRRDYELTELRDELGKRMRRWAPIALPGNGPIEKDQVNELFKIVEDIQIKLETVHTIFDDRIRLRREYYGGLP